MVSRALHADEKSLFAFTIARDGIALVVHADNPVKALGRAQVVDILSGKTSNWKAVGGRDAPIEVCSRKPGHSSIEIVTHFFGLAPEAIRQKHVAGDNAEALRMLLADRNLLTYFSVGLAEDSAQKGLPLRTLAVDGVAATSAAVRNGSYPLSRPLNLVTRGVPKGAARAFIEFVQLPRARAIIAEYDFVPYGH
jgi:phosphate transport system substrate-binding protein